jgi:hypothetical protein
VANKQIEYIILPYKNGLEHLNANVVVKVSNGLIGKQSFKKIRTIEIKCLYLSINLKREI